MENFKIYEKISTFKSIKNIQNFVVVQFPPKNNQPPTYLSNSYETMLFNSTAEKNIYIYILYKKYDSPPSLIIMY